MQLPQSLSPWSTYLTLLAAPLPWSLGPTIKCLDLVMGPSRTAFAEESYDEPEGYDGIARKGSYERLVLSEWLLADEFPDEFLRRSSVGEHAFLELSRRSPSGKKRTTVLFDCGPNQLGSPRVAHLAVLIVLARRAESNGMEVEWGILQDGSSTLVAGASKESIEKLLASRTVHEVTDKDIDRWFGTVADRNVVIMGGARLSRMMWRRSATLLTIEDILEPGENALAASYSASAGNRKSQFHLPLPPELDCVRILNNPFEDTSKDEERDHEKPATNEWSLVVSGEFFLLRQSSRCVMSLRAPPTARSRGLRQRLYAIKEREALVASGANVAGAALAVLTSSPRERNHKIVLIGAAGLPNYSTHHLYAQIDLQHLKVSEGGEMRSIFPAPNSNAANQDVWVHVGGKVLEIPSRSGNVMPKVIADGVLWLTRSRGTIGGVNQDVLVYGRESQNQFSVVIVGFESHGAITITIPGRPMFCLSSEILIAYRDERLGFYGFVSYPQSGSVADSIHYRQFLQDETPIAMIEAGHFGIRRTGLLTISNDRRDLHVVSSGEVTRMRLPQATSTIRSVAVNHLGIVAYITDRVLTIVWPDGEWQPFVFDGYRFNSQWEGG